MLIHQGRIEIKEALALCGALCPPPIRLWMAGIETFRIHIIPKYFFLIIQQLLKWSFTKKIVHIMGI